MDKPLCSIIVPIFNVQALLPRCIESLINQEYENIEIILVNDGSTDNCETICRKYEKKDSRIKVITKLNGGLSSARNAGIDIAKGDILFFVDSDDYVTADFCSTAVQEYISKKADIVVFGFNTIFVDQGKTKKRHANASSFLTKKEAFMGILIDGYINNLAWNKAYKRELFDTVRYPNGKVFEDVFTTYKLINKADRIYITDKITYNYELRGGSISNKWWNSDKKINDFFYGRFEQLQFFKNNDHSLLKYSYATTGFVAIMADTFLKEKNKDVIEFLISEKVYLIHSAFPYSILFRLWYWLPAFSKKVLKMIFK